MDPEFRILCDGVEIGTMLLEERDEAMGTANGTFVPSPAYARVRPIFRLFADAQRDTGPSDQEMIARYYRERDKLDLTVTGPDGRLVPTSVVHIADFADESLDGLCEVELHIEDPTFFGGRSS